MMMAVAAEAALALAAATTAANASSGFYCFPVSVAETASAKNPKSRPTAGKPYVKGGAAMPHFPSIAYFLRILPAGTGISVCFRHE